MQQTFEIITDVEKLCELVNAYSKRGRKFHITPWSSGTESGFVFWHY